MAHTTPDLPAIHKALRDTSLDAVAQELNVSVEWLRMIVETDAFESMGSRTEGPGLGYPALLSPGALDELTNPRAPK